jgi:hypothetical protein
MDATPIDFGEARPLAGGASRMGIDPPSDDPTVVTATWLAIHEAAATVGTIAGVDRLLVAREIRRGLAIGPKSGCDGNDEDVQDLADVMQRGISALLTAHTCGGSPHAAAGALWREFLATRDAMLAPRFESTMTRLRP